MARISWDEFFIRIALVASLRSTCDRALVGCVITVDNRVLTTGFNGSVKKQAHCNEEGHLIVDDHCVRTIHAEANAIIQAALNGVSIDKSTAYITHFPCLNCSKMLINAGIKRIVFLHAYRVDDIAMQFLSNANVTIDKMTLGNDVLFHLTKEWKKEND